MTSRKCPECKNTKPLDAEHFRRKPSNSWTKYCVVCLQWRAKQRERRREEDGNNATGKKYRVTQRKQIDKLRAELGLDRKPKPLYRAGSIADADRLQRRLTV